jgi:hypothetical protein
MPKVKKVVNRKVNFSRMAEIAYDSLSGQNKETVGRSIGRLQHRVRIAPDNRFIRPVSGINNKFIYRPGANNNYYVVFEVKGDEIEIDDIVSGRVVELYKADNKAKARNNEKISRPKV